jgi:hypothetical protein
MNSLYQKTLELLEATEQPLREIAEGAELPYDWLVALRYDRIKNPSVNRVQKLYEYLNGRKLVV